MRHAATAVVVRPGAGGFEVLLGKRSERSRFVAGAHVFPGGTVDEADGDAVAMALAGGKRDPWRMAAIRETFEETGIGVGLSSAQTLRHGVDFFGQAEQSGISVDFERLTYLSTWVTPEGLPLRYDTRFYLTVAEAGAQPEPDGAEIVEAVFVEPVAALRTLERGRWWAVAPTVAHLRYLAAFGDVASLLRGAKAGSRRDLVDQAVVEGRRPAGLAVEP